MSVQREQIEGQIRHLINTVGALLGTYGVMTEEQWAAISGVLIALIPFVWSWRAKLKSRGARPAKLRSLAVLAVLLLPAAGCSAWDALRLHQAEASPVNASATRPLVAGVLDCMKGELYRTDSAVPDQEDFARAVALCGETHFAVEMLPAAEVGVQVEAAVERRLEELEDAVNRRLEQLERQSHPPRIRPSVEVSP